MLKSVVIATVCALSLNAMATTTQQVQQVKAEIEPLLIQIKGVNLVGISSCYVGSDVLIRPGTLPASEQCIEVGFENQEQLDQAKAVLNSPLKVNGVAIAFLVIGQVRAQ